MARSTHRHIARASDPSSLTSFAVTTVAVLHGCWRPRTLSLSPPQAAHFYSWGRCAYGSLRRARARYVCMRRVGPDGWGGVGRGRVACWASVATVAMCRHDPYSIYLMFAIVALSPDALECPGKYVYHRFGIFTQCAGPSKKGHHSQHGLRRGPRGDGVYRRDHPTTADWRPGRHGPWRSKSAKKGTQP